MALLKSILKILRTILPFEDFMYILQQEEYLSKRYIYWLKRFSLKRNFQKRDTFKRTPRGLVVLAGGATIWLFSIVIPIFFNQSVLTISWGVVSTLLIPLWILISNIATYPAFAVERIRRQKTASRIVQNMPNLKIVGIAGSFGKTTVKNFVFQFAKYTYKAQMIPGNINTPNGIAAWVVNYLKKETTLLVCEMDTYQIGEVQRTCTIVPADIAVITNFGDQHMIRFANSEELAAAISEVFKYSKQNAKLITSEKVPGYKKKTITPEKNSDNPSFSDSNIENLNMARAVAKELNIPERYIKDVLKTIELPDRRQKETILHGFTAIDDSYNISFITAQAGIQSALELAKREKKKLICIAAGIPELAISEAHHNKDLGKTLMEKADFTIILNSIFANEVSNSFLKKSDFSIQKDLQSAIVKLSKDFSPEKWVLLMQPELTDLYYD